MQLIHQALRLIGEKLVLLGMQLVFRLSTKVMTAGEGGMLTTNDRRIYEFARSMQHRGRDLNHDQELYFMPGRNVRMTEPSALIGRVQLSHLNEMLHRRRHIGSIYKRELNKRRSYN